jgi:hypothetical protein
MNFSILFEDVEYTKLQMFLKVLLFLGGNIGFKSHFYLLTSVLTSNSLFGLATKKKKKKKKKKRRKNEAILVE